MCFVEEVSGYPGQTFGGQLAAARLLYWTQSAVICLFMELEQAEMRSKNDKRCQPRNLRGWHLKLPDREPRNIVGFPQLEPNAEKAYGDGLSPSGQT